VNVPLFPATSRYASVPTEKHTMPDGRVVVCLRRRFLPAPERFALLHERVVRQGERLDVLSAQILGDAEQFWRLCDSNGVLRPEELTETPGARIRVTLPEGIPGTPHA
jgi:hypothetical protein